jgi:hypothetical protein
LQAHARTRIGHFSWTKDVAQRKINRTVLGYPIMETLDLNGLLLSFTPEVLNKVGGFKVLPARWGYEHINWTRRIVKAELAPFTADICNSNQYVRINPYGAASTLSCEERQSCAQANQQEAYDLSQVYCPLIE